MKTSYGHGGKAFIIFCFAWLSILALSFLVAPEKSMAATITWDGGGSTNDWSEGANWSGDTAPGSGDIAAFDNTSDKDATIDAAFGGTVSGINILSGYNGTVTQARTLTINGSYSQADGFFVGGSQSITLNSDGAVSITGGTFTSTTGTLSIERNFTVSGSGVFVGNGGTVTFVANIIFDATVITCGDVTFSTVVFDKDGGGGTNNVTVSSGCTIPLGNNAVSSADTITNNGTINVGTGTWTINGNYTQNSGSALTMGGTAMVIDTNGSLTLNGGTFPAGLATLSVERNLDNTGNVLPDGIALTLTDFQTQDAATLTCGDVTFGSVVFNKDEGNTITISSGCTIPLGDDAVSSAGTITNNGTINVGTGTWTIHGSYTQNNGSVLTMAGTAMVLDTNGSLTLNGGTFPAGLTTLSIERDLDNTGNLLPDGIDLTLTDLTLDPTTLTCGDVTFGSVVFNKDEGNTITVSSGCTIPLGDNAVSSGIITNNGTINVGTGTWTIHGSYTQNNGSVLTMGGTAMVIDTDGSLTLNGGTFPAGLTTLSIHRNLDNTGNLLPDGIALTITNNGFNDNTTLECGDASFSSITLNKDSGDATTLDSDCTTTTLTRTDGALSNPASAYTLYVGGNISISTTDTFGGSNLTIEMNGGTGANITQNAGTFSAKLKINKTVGTSVTQSTNLVLGDTMEITSGTFSQGATYNLTTGGTLTVGASGTWSNLGTGDITLAGNVSNAGTITLDGSGSSCGQTDAITLTSSASAQRTWSGAGTFNLRDLTVSWMAGGQTALSSTDDGNNDWTFAGCPTTTIGDGADPSNSTIAPSSAITDLDAFTLTTSFETDSVTALTVTLASGMHVGISEVRITSSDGSTTYFSAISNLSSETLNFSGGTAIPVSTSAATFKVRITPKTHANMPAIPGESYDVTGTVTSFTSTNGQLGSDTDSATITIDNESPANVTSASATAGDAQAALSWTNPADADFSTSVILRGSSLVSDNPVEGTDYIVNDTIGTATVVCVTSSTSCTDGGLTNGTAYHYLVFTQDSNGNYSETGTVPTGSPVTPVSAPSTPSSSSSKNQFRYRPIPNLADLISIVAPPVLPPPIFATESDQSEPALSPEPTSSETGSSTVSAQPISQENYSEESRMCTSVEKRDIRKLINTHYREARDEIISQFDEAMSLALLSYEQALSRINSDKEAALERLGEGRGSGKKAINNKAKSDKALAKNSYKNTRATLKVEKNSSLEKLKDDRASMLEKTREECIVSLLVDGDQELTVEEASEELSTEEISEESSADLSDVDEGGGLTSFILSRIEIIRDGTISGLFPYIYSSIKVFYLEQTDPDVVLMVKRVQQETSLQILIGGAVFGFVFTGHVLRKRYRRRVS